MQFDLVGVLDDALVARATHITTTTRGGNVALALVEPHTMSTVGEWARTLLPCATHPHTKGRVHVRYIVVSPFAHPTLAIGKRTYWKETHTLPVIGHRRLPGRGTQPAVADRRVVAGAPGRTAGRWCRARAPVAPTSRRGAGERDGPLVSLARAGEHGAVLCDRGEPGGGVRGV